jgi:hypothetical protein
MILPLAPALQAQIAAAPLPSQILTAKKVFIANAGTVGSYSWSGGQGRPYNELYAAIKSWGRYELVGAPSDADLVYEISYSSQITNVSGSKESGCDSSNSSWLKLALLDPRTRIVLWTITENIKPFARPKTGDKNFDDAIDRLVGDLKALVAQPAAAAN